MDRRNLLNAGLLALVVVLAAILYFQPGVDQEPSSALTTLRAESVKSIRLQKGEGEVIVLEKRDNDWWVTEPFETVANTFRVETVLGVLESAMQSRFPVQDQDLSRFGLDQPLAVMKVDGDVEIAFGGIESLNRYRYVRVGDSMALVHDPFFQVFVDATAFAALQLFPSDSRLTYLGLRDAVLSRHDSGNWHVASSEDWSADRVAGFIRTWRHAQAARITRYTEVAGVPQIRVRLDGGSEIVFDVLDGQDEIIFARRDLGLGYHFSEEQGEKMLGLSGEFDYEGASIGQEDDALYSDEPIQP